MNQRIRDNAVLKQLRSAVGLEENDYEPASRLEGTELGLFAAYPFPFVGPTKPGLNDAGLREKKLKLFMHAQDKDHREESYEYLGELRAELSQLSPVQVAALCRSRDERENTALHYAAKAGNLDVCKLLERGGADIKAEGENKMKPLQFAARYGDEKRASDVWDCMEWIIAEYEKRCFDVREKDKYMFTEHVLVQHPAPCNSKHKLGRKSDCCQESPQNRKVFNQGSRTARKHKSSSGCAP